MSIRFDRNRACFLCLMIILATYDHFVVEIGIESSYLSPQRIKKCPLADCLSKGDVIGAGRYKLAHWAVSTSPALKQTLGGEVQIRKSPTISRALNRPRFKAAKGLAMPPVFFQRSQGEPIQERFA